MGTLPKKHNPLPRETKWIDEKNRVVIPDHLREAAGINKESWVLIEAYPSLENCKKLIIGKA